MVTLPFPPPLPQSPDALLGRRHAYTDPTSSKHARIADTFVTLIANPKIVLSLRANV